MFQTNIIMNEAADTSKIGALLAKHSTEGDLITLSGILGSGKTTLARGFIEEAGINDPIPSPTYTIVQSYNTSLGDIIHIDAWRLEGIDDAWELGMQSSWCEKSSNFQGPMVSPLKIYGISLFLVVRIFI